MPASRDPRSYAKPVPLPVPSCKGVQLLARDTFNFNTEEPSRETVRKNNYYRRQAQMSQMGFKSLNHKPYQGIGDPFYLDEKKMILHALGQWNEEESESSASSDESDDVDKKTSQKQSAMTAAKFVLRRSRKDLNTLNKAVVHGRNMIRNVSLGHGLFDLITEEKQDKKVASELAFRKRQEQLRNEFQPPKTESDKDTDNDIENEVDLAKMAIAEEEEEYLRARSAAVTSVVRGNSRRLNHTHHSILICQPPSRRENQLLIQKSSRILMFQKMLYSDSCVFYIGYLKL